MDLNEEDYHRHASHHHAPFYSVALFTTTTGKWRRHRRMMNEAQEIDGGVSSGGS
ncbi:hypothetical protein Bca4012_051709 [Brassica carinata]|uniref:Uncharacterized protein n=3 Tax=Brassica TaxID=3705 RepID=A0ABQ7CCY0_BRACR|nr:hypothetical protein DY000_02010518 [Brassica cretica]KAG2292199.1 hypothetical protein Bca52824_038868 [Brassica carinata]